MEEQHLSIREENLRTELLPVLCGRVFHVTTLEAYASILKQGAIKSNETGEFPYSYGMSENSYFRKRGCVSVFDLRAIRFEHWEFAELPTGFGAFLNPAAAQNKPVFLFLRDCCDENLIKWVESPESRHEMVIDNAEAGHKGDIPISHIQLALQVEIEKPRIKRGGDQLSIAEIDEIVAAADEGER
jgi:hypothetical protein